MYSIRVSLANYVPSNSNTQNSMFTIKNNVFIPTLFRTANQRNVFRNCPPGCFLPEFFLLPNALAFLVILF